MSGGKVFCTLDKSQAYFHMEMDRENGGTLPNIWQRFIEQTVQVIKGVGCFFDNIIVQRNTYEELLHRLREIYDYLFDNGLHLNKSKYKFVQKSITYQGHFNDEEGSHLIP